MANARKREMDLTWGDYGIEHCSSYNRQFQTSSSCGCSSIEGYPYPFEGIEQMAKTIDKLCGNLQAGLSTEQYITFTSVESSDLEEINENRSLIGKCTRLSYDEVLKELSVKLMPSILHDAAHIELSLAFYVKVGQMGLQVRGVGSGRYNGTHRSKEADSAFKPLSRPGKEAWPSIVIESGLLESLSHLREDADFWLRESGGKVQIVILVAIPSGGERYQLEKWEWIGQNPTKVQELIVDRIYRAVYGAPLQLGFQKVILRPPVGQETDILFSVPELLQWADWVWTSGK